MRPFQKRAEQRRQRILNELLAIRGSCRDPIDRQFVTDMILYVEVGKDRMNLRDDYVERVRHHLANPLFPKATA